MSRATHSKLSSKGKKYMHSKHLTSRVLPVNIRLVYCSPVAKGTPKWKQDLREILLKLRSEKHV